MNQIKTQKSGPALSYAMQRLRVTWWLDVMMAITTMILLSIAFHDVKAVVGTVWDVAPSVVVAVLLCLPAVRVAVMITWFNFGAGGDLTPAQMTKVDRFWQYLNAACLVLSMGGGVVLLTWLSSVSDLHWVAMLAGGAVMLLTAFLAYCFSLSSLSWLREHNRPASGV